MKWNWNVPFEPGFRARIGRYTLYAAISGFMVHLGLIGLKTLFPDWISSNFLAHPINAIYTPFSILLFFESYLLIYYLRQSTTFYIGKQYEIIALILIRGIFKDMTHLDLQAGSFQTANNLELARDLGAVMLVFGMIFFTKLAVFNSTSRGLGRWMRIRLVPIFDDLYGPKRSYPFCYCSFLPFFLSRVWYSG
jgi:hypothetical protein